MNPLLAGTVRVVVDGKRVALVVGEDSVWLTPREARVLSMRLARSARDAERATPTKGATP